MCTHGVGIDIYGLVVEGIITLKNEEGTLLRRSAAYRMCREHSVAAAAQDEWGRRMAAIVYGMPGRGYEWNGRER